jgi:hypothetical protein
MIEHEEWRDVVGYEGIYMVSSNGIVKSLDHDVKMKDSRCRIQIGRTLKLQVSKKGYRQVCLRKNGSGYNTGVHRLVAKAFVPNPENKDQVNHKNGIKLDNNFLNLEWASNRENIIHAYKNNLIKLNSGEKHHNSKITDAQELDAFIRFNNGETLKSISLEFGLSIAAISKRITNINNKNQIK